MQSLREKDRAAYDKAAGALRSDGAWIDAGENDSVIVAAVDRMPHVLGVVGYPLFERNETRLSASPVDGVAPTRDAIAAETYPLSRTLRVYAKAASLAADPAASAFLKELTGPGAVGSGGYLIAEGLIPMRPAP